MMMMRGQTVWNCQKCGRRLQRCRCCHHSLRPASCFPQKLRALRVLARVLQYLHRCFNIRCLQEPEKIPNTACHHRYLLTSVYISGRETMFDVQILLLIVSLLKEKVEHSPILVEHLCTFYICQNLISPVS